LLYSLIARLLVPSAWWGRLRVKGMERVPAQGALLVVPNHDSQWDPVVLALALRKRRKLRFLARANLWRIPGLAPILNGLRQIPIERGAQDAQALERAIAALEAADAVCVFPEGKLSRGARLEARTGVARLAAGRAGVRVVLCAIEGTTDYARFPRRPRVTITFFEPGGGQPRAGEDLGEMATRFLDEIRARVPPVPAGRRPRRAST
jgi:1-acyl-sn-glycerol-3-phosphate acyltransferase